MKTWFLFIIVFLNSLSFYAQNAVSGYLNFENPKDWEQKIYLSAINSNDTSLIAAAEIGEDGYFSFDKSFFKLQEALYKLHVNRLLSEEKQQFENSIKTYEIFMLSSKDSMYFQKGSKLFSNFTTSSKANLEWQRYNDFKQRLTDENSSENYLFKTKGFIKDSVQILMVKLFSIRTLEEKNLLERDIQENPEYYLDLLEELKSSELDPLAYLQYENKIRTVNQQIVQEKYRLSRVLNIIGFLVLVGLLIVIFKVGENAAKIPEVHLSKQENIIKNLILEGKTNKEIANELFISPSTVKTHITNIYSKLQVSGRKELLLKT